MKKLLFIIGSLRKDGFNYQLSNYVFDLLKDKYDISYLDYANTPYFNQDVEKEGSNVINDIKNNVMESDGIVIFTPEYNLSYPGVLKNLLNWLSRPLKLNDFNSGTAMMGKKVCLLGIGGKNGTKLCLDKLTDLLKFMQVELLDDKVGFIVNNEAWVNNKVVLDNNQLEELKLFIKKIKDFI